MTVPFLDLAATHAPLTRAFHEAFDDVLDSGGFIGGDHVAAFEQRWARYCATTHAVGVANGTDALTLALRALAIGAGDEVIVPTNTFVATAEAVVSAGARPRFVDVDPDTLLLTPETLDAAIGPDTAAVMVVHLFGQPADMDGILRVARTAGIAVVEDAAQAHGATWSGRRVGSFGDVGCFSFYPGKNLGALGDGGAVVTDDDDLAERIRSMANHGRAAGTHHVHDVVGMNSRLDGLQAAFLDVKLDHLDAWAEGRRRVASHYDEALADLPLRPVQVRPEAVAVHHLQVVRVGDRDRVREALSARGIGTGVHYPVPCHLQPAFAQRGAPALPEAEQAAGEILSLPMFPTMSEAQVRAVAEALADVLEPASSGAQS